MFFFTFLAGHARVALSSAHCYQWQLSRLVIVKGAKERLDEEIKNKRISRMEDFKEKVLSGSIPLKDVAREAAEEFQTSTRYGRYYRRVFLEGSD